MKDVMEIGIFCMLLYLFVRQLQIMISISRIIQLVLQQHLDQINFQTVVVIMIYTPLMEQHHRPIFFQVS